MYSCGAGGEKGRVWIFGITWRSGVDALAAECGWEEQMRERGLDRVEEGLYMVEERGREGEGRERGVGTHFVTMDGLAGGKGRN